jgi:hypothetical protein
MGCDVRYMLLAEDAFIVEFVAWECAYFADVAVWVPAGRR